MASKHCELKNCPIVSKRQWRYYLKGAGPTAKFIDSNGNTITGGSGLDLSGQASRAGRNKEGKIIKAGGGKPYPPPPDDDCAEIIRHFLKHGGPAGGPGDPNKLPEQSMTANAIRKRDEYPETPGGEAKSPPGAPTLARAARKAAAAAAKGAASPANVAKKPKKKSKKNESKRYISNSINEEFNLALNKALGIL